MTSKQRVISSTIGLILAASLLIRFLPGSVPISPLGTTPATSSIAPAEHYLILGFIPYWNIKKLTPIAKSSVTHIAYFNLRLSADGTLYTHVNRREEDPSYTNYKRLLTHTIDFGSQPLVLTFMPKDQAALNSILATPATRHVVIETITSALKESGSTGLNIDFEPLGDTSPELRDSFTHFIHELKQSLSHTTMLTLSIYPSAASRPRLWDLTALTTDVAYFVVMTYDYAVPGDATAGPNAPLRGAGQLFEHDVIKNIAELSAVIPAEKILLGIPFYGYEWQTVDSTKYAPTTERGSVASLERIQTMIDNQTLELLWDRNTLTPYGIASSAGQISQIYFENTTSIELKLEFVKSAHLGGIAIWALGYEGENSPLWKTITDTLSSRPGTP